MIKFIIHTLKKKYPRWFISKGLLSYNDLVILVELGIIDANLDKVQGSSIDVVLDNFIRVEVFGSAMDKVRLGKRESIETTEICLDNDNNGEYALMPNAFILASTAETINLPSWLSAEFRLKSTIGRNGLDHALAVWCDPYFKGKVTLELKNNTQFKKLVINSGMPIGQIAFTKHSPLPFGNGYAAKGQYMNQSKVTESKGVR